MMLDVAGRKSWKNALVGLVLACCGLLLPAPGAWAAAQYCPDPNVQVTLETGYCELCGGGRVQLRISNNTQWEAINLPSRSETVDSGDRGFDDIEVIVDLQQVADVYGTSGYSAGFAGQSGSQLRWNLGDLARNQSRTVSFNLDARDFDQEKLTIISRQIETSVEFEYGNCQGGEYRTRSGSWPNNSWEYFNYGGAPYSEGPFYFQSELSVEEPRPGIAKAGRNVDAGMPRGTFSNDPDLTGNTIFGHEDDGVIWRVTIDNYNGNEPMYDVIFDDSMAPTVNMDVLAVCRNETDAENVAQGGSASAGTCTPISGDELNGRHLQDDFGFPLPIEPNDEREVFIAGTLRNSCVDQVNVADNVQWGCLALNGSTQVEGEAGITQSILGGFPSYGAGNQSSLEVSSSPSLIPGLGSAGNFSNTSELNYDVTFTGLNPNEPVGMRGMVTITIENRTGGTVNQVELTNTLPDEYILDPNFEPQFTISSFGGAYNNYPGRVSEIDWRNRVAPSANQTSYLNNPALKAPNFYLSSVGNPLGETANDQAEQEDLLRHGDIVTITFRIVQVNQDGSLTYYDRMADLDENNESLQPGTLDPPVMPALTNTLRVQWGDFCGSNDNGSTRSNEVVTQRFTPEPENLNVDIPEPLYIIRDTGPTSVSVFIHNSGGHTATDYLFYVTFGNGLLVTPPASCTSTNNPPQHPDAGAGQVPLWNTPPSNGVADHNADGNPLPDGAFVFRCDLGPIAPGPARELEFSVEKNHGATYDDITMRADVVGEVRLADNNDRDNPQSVGEALVYPTPANLNDPIRGTTPSQQLANNYTLDAVRARALGFNLLKRYVPGSCKESNTRTSGDGNGRNTPPQILVGEDCDFEIFAGGWFGFKTPGWDITVDNIDVADATPDHAGGDDPNTGRQGFISETRLTCNTPGLNTLSPNSVCDQIIAPVGFTPGVPLSEDNLTWDFGGTQVTERNHWFLAGMTSRLLNNPVDQVAEPNLHSNLSVDYGRTSFRVTYESEKSVGGVPEPIFEETIANDGTGAEPACFKQGDDWNPLATDSCNSAYPGYPQWPDWTAQLQITEPKLHIVKEVCNFSRAGENLGACVWEDEEVDGSKFDDFVYRLTVANEQENGPAAAPAYDTVITDILRSPQMCVWPFAEDGLNNTPEGNNGLVGINNIGANDYQYDPANPDADIHCKLNGDPAYITFTYESSAALQKIDSGDSVQLYYRVTPHRTVVPNQTFDNTAAIFRYDSLNALAGNQNDPRIENINHPDVTGIVPDRAAPQNQWIGGARIYCANEDATGHCGTDDATMRIVSVDAEPKAVVEVSTTATGAPTQAGISPATPVVGPDDRVNVVVGEEVRFRLIGTVPAAELRNLTFRDELPEGLRCVEVDAVDLRDLDPDAVWNPGAGDGVTTPKNGTTCDENVVEWRYGSQYLTDYDPSKYPEYDGLFPIELTFVARVENSAATFHGATLTNPGGVAQMTYEDQNGVEQEPAVFEPISLNVLGPRIDLEKTFSVEETDAGDVITVTVTATNSGSATAYNLRVLDNLEGTKLTYIGGIGGINQPDNDANGLDNNAPIFSWDRASNPDYAIASGEAKTFTFQVQADEDVEPYEILDNTIQAAWQSLPSRDVALNLNNQIGENGSIDGMRNGQLPEEVDPQPGDINDYEAEPATAQTEVPPLQFTKNDITDPALVPTIGTHRQFELLIDLPEGITNGVQIDDNMSDGIVSYVLNTDDPNFSLECEYQDIETIDSGSGPATAPASDPECSRLGVPINDSDTVIWNIGTVDTASEDDNSASDPDYNPQIRIRYWARINNDDVTDDGDDLSNRATLSYTNGQSGATEQLIAETAAVTALEPLLTIDKSVANENGNVNAEGGDTLIYTLVISHDPAASNSTAFDLSIIDSLAPQLVLDTDSVTLDLQGAGCIAADGFQLQPQAQPDGSVVWGRARGDNSLDLPLGCSATLTYKAGVQGAFGGTIPNTAIAGWTSQDQEDDNQPYERDDSDCIDGVPNGKNDYCTKDDATIITEDNTFITKSVVSDSFAPADDASVRIGDTVTYRLQLGLQPGTTQNVVVTDQLPTGLVLESVVSTSCDQSGFSCSAATLPALPASGTVEWRFGNIERSSPEPFEIQYIARVTDDPALAEAASAELQNQAQLSYTGSDEHPTPDDLQDDAVITVLQPVFDTLVKSERDGKTSPYTVIDLLNDVMRFRLQACNSGGAPAYSIELTDDLAPQMDQLSIENLVVSIFDGTNEAPLTEGSEYTYIPPESPGDDMLFSLTTPVVPGQCLYIDYDIGFQSDVGGGETWPNTFTINQHASLPDSGGRQYAALPEAAPFIMTTAEADAAPLLKELVTPEDGTATIGELVRYRITIPQEPIATSSLTGVVVTDSLDGLGDIMEFESATLNGEPIEPASPTNLTFDIGVITAGSTAELEIVVRVADVAGSVDGTVINNSADYSYIENGNPVVGGGNAVEFTIVEPNLIMDKEGPAEGTLQSGLPGRFTLDMHNTGGGEAWDITVTDLLPNSDQGGMCETPPEIVAVEIFDDAGVVQGTLAQGTDYNTTFDADNCVLTLTTSGAGATLLPDHHLRVSYDAFLDADTEHNAVLTNVAGATQWHSLDSTQPEVRIYTPGFTNDPPDGTPDIEDHEDAFTLTAEVPRISFYKVVEDITSGANPASEAVPGDVLQYTLTLTNLNDLDVENIEITDELDRLNSMPLYQSGSLQIVSAPAGADTSGTDAAGGANGSGLLSAADLSLAAGDSLEIVYQVTLAPVIDSGSAVLNQAQVQLPGQLLQDSDDPNINGAYDPDEPSDEGPDPTQVLIKSAPELVVEKISQDITGDADLLMPGDTLRYTITIENTGNENAIEATLRDQVPANTTYVPNSTTLNGAAVADVDGSTPLAAAMPINSAGEEEGFIGATEGTQPVVVTFDVTINDVRDGTIVSNQGFVNGEGAGSGPFAEKPSDDPTTDTPDDPTIDIVGDVPLLIVQKTVEIAVDNVSAGIVDPGDTLRYTITVANMGGVDATDAVLTDQVPADTTYVGGTTTLNGIAVTDNAGGMTRLDSGLPISSSDLTPPLPGAGEGVITSAQTATITFDVQVDADTATGTVISNQGSVATEELPLTLTDADGNPSNGAQPTEVVVGDAQQLSITKEVAVVGGGAALPGATLEYRVSVTNISAVPVTEVVITDDLLVAGEGVLTYVADSALLNGQPGGISVAGSVITADYGATYGELPVGEVATLRFQAKLGENLEIGYQVLNTAEVAWNDPPSTEQASVIIDVGGTPGIANLSGFLWHDVNFNDQLDAEERLLSGWTVDLYFNNALLDSLPADEDGYFQFAGLVPNMTGGASYELRYQAPNATETTASLGNTSSDFTNGPQQITEIFVGSGSNPQNLNLPITPNGVVYDSVLRQPVSGAMLTLLRASGGQELPDRCFDDEKQQGQVVPDGGYYKFDINFSDAACPANADYLIQVQVPGDGYVDGQSLIIPPQTDEETAGFDVGACLGSNGDVVPGTADHCEVQESFSAPGVDVDARDPRTDYYLRLTLDDDRIPGENQLFNNHIPVDPLLEGALSITKTASMLNVTRSQLVPYTITFSNTLPVPLADLQLVDFFPAGFKYVAGSARLDGLAVEPEVEGLQLHWNDLRVDPDQTRTVKLLLVVGSGVGEGKYVNRAQMFNQLSGQAASGEASATVRVVPDPTFDCSDVIGKVYDDKNMNGYQDQGEGGVPGARVVTATGLNATTDAYGRFHITCAVVPNWDRGSNFIMKLDDRSLPSGYRLTSENPRVVRATRGKAIKVNFGASLHRVVRLDMAEGVFEPETIELRPQWHSRTELLLEKLSEAPSVLRLSYLAENEDPDLVEQRLQTIKAQIAADWAEQYGDYELTIETEVFWRRGAPPKQGGLE